MKRYIHKDGEKIGIDINLNDYPLFTEKQIYDISGNPENYEIRDYTANQVIEPAIMSEGGDSVVVEAVTEEVTLNGWQLLTESQLIEKEDKRVKDQAKKDCDNLYKQLRKSFYIQETEVYEFDIEALLLFDSQLKNKTSDIKVKEKGSKIKPLTKTKSTNIMTKVNTYLESISDAHSLDWDLIELEDYTLPNLTAIKEAQEAF